MKQFLILIVLALVAGFAYLIFAPGKIAEPTLEDYAPLQRMLANEHKEKGASTESIEAEINALQKELDALEKERQTCEASIQAKEEKLKQWDRQLGNNTTANQEKTAQEKEIDALKLQLQSLENQKRFEQSQIENAQKEIAKLEKRYADEKQAKRNRMMSVHPLSWMDYQKEKSRYESDIRMANNNIKKLDLQIKTIIDRIEHASVGLPATLTSADLTALRNNAEELRRNLEKTQDRLAEIQRQSEEKKEMLKQKQTYILKVKAFYEDEEKLLKAGLLEAYVICQSFPSPRDANRLLVLAKKSNVESWEDFYSYLNVHDPAFIDTLKDRALKTKYQEYLTNFKLSTIKGSDILIDLAAVDDDDLAQIEAIIREKYQQ